MSQIFDENGELIGFSELSRDIRNQKRLIEHMQQMILIDELTGLLDRSNRAMY